MILFSLFSCFNIYADDFSIDSDISEVFPEPPGISEKKVIFEPDPNDIDGDGILTSDEEKYGTDPNDPDTDNDGFTDFWEVTNGTDPNNKNTTGYLEVVDIEAEDKNETSSENIIDANDLPPLPWDNETYLPEVIDDKELENTSEYTDIIPPILDNEEDLSLSRDNDDSISKDSLNDIADEENEQQVMLDSTTSGKDLTPIYMLLLLNDNDNDGIDDDWEIRYFGSIEDCDPGDDPDVDNLSNLGEYNNHTDPNNHDTDGDGLTDGWEVVNSLNPTSTDSDGDTMSDGWEVTYDLNPLVNDAYNDLDNDGYPNYFEYVSQTVPTDPNSHPSGIIYNFNYDNNGNLAAMQRRE